MGTALSAMPYTIEVDGIYYNSIAPNTLSVTYKDEGYNSYSGDIVIPGNLIIRGHNYIVTAIDSCAFKDCTGLTSVQLPITLTAINNNAFAGCTSLREMDIPDDVTTIGAHAFEGCTSLTDVFLPVSLTSIGIHAFSKCSSLTSIDIPDNVTLLGGYAFSECSSLTTVKLSQKLSVINDHTFYICRKLTSIVIPNQVSSIGYAAFQSCSSMTSLVLGKGVSKLEDKAFRGCYALQDITCYRDTPPTWNGFDCFAEVNYTDATLHVRRIRIDLYREATGWKKFKHINEIPYEREDDGIYYIELNPSAQNKWGVSFKDYGYNSYKGEVNIPATLGGGSPRPKVVMILHDAFRDCDSLTSVSMSDNIHTIEERAFMNSTALKELTISNGVTAIPDSAFMGCSSLTSLTLPNGLKSIGVCAFSGCDNLESLNIGVNVSHLTLDARAMENYTALKAINCYAMMPPVVTGDCFSAEQLASVVLYVQPSSLMDYKLDPFWGRFAHIEPWTYDFCAAGIYYIITSPTECAVSNHAPMGGSYTAQSITIPEKATYAGDDYKVTAIGKGAFMNCPKVKTVTMPQSVTAIGEQAFKNSGLTSIVFPKQVTAIDRQAFMGCTGLKSLTIPDHIYAIEDSAFYGCHGLTSLDLGKSVTFISNYAFASCYNLSKVYIPHSVEAICNGAFQDCTMLTGVTLDRDFESLSIDGDVFRDCYNLSSITSLPLTPPVLDNQHGGLSSELMQKVSLMVPHSSVEAYRNAEVWGEFANIRPLTYDFDMDNIYYLITGAGSVSVVNNGYTNGYSGEVVIPSVVYLDDNSMSVTAIADSAFMYCGSLRSVTVPNSVHEIGSYAFTASGLKQITLSKSITEIKDYTFANCGLGSITIPDKVTRIGHLAFFGCSDLHDVVLPEGLQSIGEGAFLSAGFFPGYLNVNLPNTLTQLGNAAFMGSEIHSITIPASLDTIPLQAFAMCMKLQHVTIPNTVKSIGGLAFYSNNSLKSITIPNSVKRIDYGAFMWCDVLDSVTIGNGIEHIEEWAFGKLSDSYFEDLIATIEGAMDSVDIDGIDDLIEGWKELIADIIADIHPLTSVTCMAAVPPVLGGSAFAASYDWAKLTVPQESLSQYKNADEWKRFLFIKADDPNDVNGDGEVNIADVNCIISAIHDDGTASPRLDANHDGEVNIADINAIIDQILSSEAQSHQ